MDTFKKNGFIFLRINRDIKLIINKINKIIIDYKKKNKINFEKIKSDDLSKHTFILQNKVNKILSPKKFFEINRKTFKHVFKEEKYSVQTYFYLRITQPHKNNPKYKPINFHRETFQGPAFFKHIMNIWIPIKNCEKSNSIKYIKGSHLFKKLIDFNFKIRKTNVKKGSVENKIGLLYKDRKIEFRNKVQELRLFKKNNFILFYGDLIHGSAKNTTNRTRFSIDLRFMIKKNMKYNPIQGVTKKKYFKIVRL